MIKLAAEKSKESTLLVNSASFLQTKIMQIILFAGV